MKAQEARETYLKCPPKAREFLLKIEEVGEQAAKRGGDGIKAMESAVKELFERQAKDSDADLARKRNDFARQATKLAEKRLDLADAEKRYNETK
jgi:hypothetical protein